MENQIKKAHHESFSFMGHHYKNVDVYSLGDSVSVVKDGKIEFVHGSDDFDELQKYVFSLIEER